MILILSAEADVHARRVMEVLDEMGREHWLMDLSEFPVQSSLSLGYGMNGGRMRRFRDARERSCDLDAVRAVWWRRPQPFRLDPQVQEQQHQMFALTECREVFQGLWRTLDASWINDPMLDDMAHRKTYQLELAESIGLSVPRTLVTNDPSDARAFIQEQGVGRTIYKPFTGTPAAWRETRLVGEDEVTKLDLVRLAPLIFQEYIEGVDIRVTVVGDRIFPAEVDVSQGDYPVDFRMNMDQATIGATELPRDVEQKLHTLMKRLGLVYGAVDFRRRADGEHVFLEINPAGQWLFVELQTGQPIARAVAERLAEAP